MPKLSKKEWIAVAAGAAFVAYTLFGAEIMNLFRANPMNEDSNLAAAQPENNQGGVIVNDIQVGNGAEARPGQKLSVNYVLSLSDGTVIQDSKDFGRPFEFTLGAGEVIPGWEQGFSGMKVGGVRTIIVPPELGYGAQQVGPIPANSTLVFTVELLDATDPSQAQ